MKILVLNYSFNAASKQITFTDYNPIIAERVLLITNTTDGIIIYNFADPLKGGTCATNILTLTYDTITMSNTDKLQIFYDDNATTIPISGTITADLSATDNAVLDAIVANTNRITEIYCGVKVVTTAGTAVPMSASSIACKKLAIQAQTDNTSVIAIGDSSVDATIATGIGIILNAGDVYEFDISNLNLVYINSLVNGEGVRFTFFR